MKHDTTPWPEVPLSTVCTKITDGTHRSPPMVASGYLYVTSKNIRPFKIELKERLYIAEADHREIYARCDVSLGDVLLTKDGANTGNAAVNCIQDEFSLLSSVALLRTDASKLDPHFLCQFLNSNKGRTQTASAMDGLAIRRLTLEKIKHLHLPLPPLSEQRKIAAILSSVDIIIEKTQAIVDQLEVVQKGLLRELMTQGMPGRHSRFIDSEFGPLPASWRTLALAQAVVEPDGLQTGPFGSQLHASDYVAEGVPVVMPKDMIDGRVDVTSIARVPESIANRLGKHRVNRGDILFARRGEIGRCALITETEVNWLAGTGCLRARPNAQVHPPFLALYFKFGPVLEWLNDHAVGQTMLNLNTEILGRTPLRLPSLEEQQEIASGFAAIEEATSTNQRQIHQLNRLKVGLLDVLLSGRVRVLMTEQEAA